MIGVSRQVELQLCDRAGRYHGRLPRFEVESPFWAEVGPVVEAARHHFRVDVTVLRLLGVRRTAAAAEVDYLAWCESVPAACRSGQGREEADSRRARWATPGGLLQILTWADQALADVGRPRIAAAEQVKTWNLSAVFRLPTATGPVWCKSVPDFLADEGEVLAVLAGPDWIPRPLAHSGELRTVLLDDVPGQDLWRAPVEVLVAMIDRLVDLQALWANRIAELEPFAGDWRASAFAVAARDLVDREEVRATLTWDEMAGLHRLVAGLPRRFAELARCGLPDSLVRGDFHPGQWRSDGSDPVLLDWAEPGIGHPSLDLLVFLSWVPEPDRARVREAFRTRWLSHRPDADPERALALAAPLGGLLRAVFFRRVLDAIEPSEYPYHADDVVSGLRSALAG